MNRLVGSGSVDVAVVGAGFAGSILARILTRQGLDVALLERSVHPRFALGESSTPLANLCLERLARRYGLEDLHELAAWGRWKRAHPGLRVGLKRGFTFYAHAAGREFENGPDNEARLMVAASPDDAIADTQWYRADVDEFLVEQAIGAGALYRDATSVEEIEVADEVVRLRCGGDEPLALEARFVIDASGGGGAVQRGLSLAPFPRAPVTRSSLVYGHFEGVRAFRDVVGLEVGPYPDEWAAVHHVTADGWMYLLRFDDGLVSAGILSGEFGRADPETAWQAWLKRFPAIERQFAGATPVRDLAMAGPLQYRLAQAVGERWLLLPHAYGFVDPLYSTGIAWSLLGVERVARMFEQIDHLVAGAYEVAGDFSLFAAHSLLYFAVVSFAEASQRLHDRDDVMWQGFLGASDSRLIELFQESFGRLREVGRSQDAAARRVYVEWARDAIAPWNVGGFGFPARHNLYPVDLELLVRRSLLLGLTREQVEERLPRLRGSTVKRTDD